MCGHRGQLEGHLCTSSVNNNKVTASNYPQIHQNTHSLKSKGPRSKHAHGLVVAVVVVVVVVVCCGASGTVHS